MLVRHRARPSACATSSDASCAIQKASGPASRSSCSTGSGRTSSHRCSAGSGRRHAPIPPRLHRSAQEEWQELRCLPGLSLYLLTCDGEPGAEIYSAAVDRDQASIVFNEAANMVERLAASVVAAVGDPLHETDRRSPQPVALSGTFGRCAGQGRPECPRCADRRAACAEDPRAVGHAPLRGRFAPAAAAPLDHHGRLRPPLDLLGAARLCAQSPRWNGPGYGIFRLHRGAADEDDWTDPEVWRKANPSFGVTVDAEQFAEDCREAKESPAKENSFRRYRLNQWTEQDVRWMSMEKWDACGGAVPKLDGETCFAGLDLSSTTDVSALVLVFPDESGYWVLPFFWVPEEGARQRERRDRVPYWRLDSRAASWRPRQVRSSTTTASASG